MILLDTNVVSAMMRSHVEPKVASWLNRQIAEELFVSTPSLFEIRFGIERKPVGRRRSTLEAAYDDVVVGVLGNRVLPFDTAAAIAAGRIRAIQSRRGQTVSVPDTQIAGIAMALNVPIATGDTSDFAGLGIELTNPWTVLK